LETRALNSNEKSKGIYENNFNETVMLVNILMLEQIIKK
jgi:hypothetical protein